MEITISEKENIKVVSLKGRLDAASAPEFEKEIETLTSNGVSLIVIDCGELDYISSAGLRVFLMTLKKLKAMNGNVALAALKETVKEVFDIAGFSSIFTITASVDNGINALK